MRLYCRIVEQARRVEFYSEGSVPDTLDGRFDMIVLLSVLLLHRLRREGADGDHLGQAYFDTMMDDMDQSLREMGVGDLTENGTLPIAGLAFDLTIADVNFIRSDDIGPTALDDPSWVSYRLAEILPVDARVKQDLLEQRSTALRVSRIAELLQSA